MQLAKMTSYILLQGEIVSFVHDRKEQLFTSKDEFQSGIQFSFLLTQKMHSKQIRRGASQRNYVAVQRD